MEYNKETINNKKEVQLMQNTNNSPDHIFRENEH